MSVTPAAAVTYTEYFIEASADGERSWKAIPGAVYRIMFHDGVVCQYASGGAGAAAEDAVGRLLADPDLGKDIYRIQGR